VRIFKTKWFMHYAKKERVGDHSLCDAIERAERGLVDTDLGGGSLSSVWRDPDRAAQVGSGY
jgi:hypothetical protein